MAPFDALLPDKQTYITLTAILKPELELFRRLLESWDARKHKFRREDILASLSRHPSLSFFSRVLQTNLNPVPFRSLLRIVLGRFQGNMAVLEEPYLEMEFWDTYAYFHSRSFRGKRKQCWRMHFFRCRGAPRQYSKQLIDHLYAGVTQKSLEEHGFHYLGFTTIRPTSSFCMGRTVLPFDQEPGGRARKGKDPLEAEGRPYCKGKAEQIANVCATRLSVDTVPFLQQDPVVGMCATASLWVASQVLAAKFDLHKYPHIDIARQATQPSLTPFVALPPDNNEDLARGLSVPEICGALVRTGAVPLVISPRNLSQRDFGRAHLQDQLYTFMESELPVIVCLSRKDQRVGHAVTAIGHLQADLKSMRALGKCSTARAFEVGSPWQFLVSLAVSRFYVHNDSYGPFDRLDFIDPQSLPRKDREGYVCPVRLSRHEDRILDIKWLVVPVPPYVKNRPDFILQDAVRRFAGLFGRPIQRDLKKRVLWRMLLVKGSRFKQSLVERRAPEALIRRYARLHLPKYVWLCEFSLFGESEVPNYLGAATTRRVDGEFIYDTTTAHYTTHAVVQRWGPCFITDTSAPSLDKAEFQKRLEQEWLLRDVPPENQLDCFTGPTSG